MDKQSKHWQPAPAPVVAPRPVEPAPVELPATPPKDVPKINMREALLWAFSKWEGR